MNRTETKFDADAGEIKEPESHPLGVREGAGREAGCFGNPLGYFHCVSARKR